MEEISGEGSGLYFRVHDGLIFCVVMMVDGEIIWASLESVMLVFVLFQVLLPATLLKQVFQV